MILKQIIKSEFIKNVFTLLSGTTAGQIIMLLMVPVIARLYTPAQFGEYSLFISIATVIAVIASGRYELAIIPAREDIRAFNLFIASLVLTVFSALLSLLAILFFNNEISFLLNNIELCKWLLLLPVSILLFALLQVLTNWYSRKKFFNILSYCKVIQAVITSIIFVLLGILKKGTLGLILGSISGQFIFIIIILIKILREESRSFKSVNKRTIREELYENRNFPYFSMPMGFLNAISMNLLIYVLNIFYTPTIVGLYAKAIRVIRLPISLLSTSFTSVFYQKLSVTERKIWLYKFSYLGIFFTGLILMLPVMFWGEPIFGFVLGSQWIKAGYIARIIAPMIIFSFATSSVSNVFPVTKTNHILLGWQVIYLAAALVIIYIFKSSSIYTLLFYFTIYGSLMYFILAVMGYYILKKRR